MRQIQVYKKDKLEIRSFPEIHNRNLVNILGCLPIFRIEFDSCISFKRCMLLHKAKLTVQLNGDSINKCLKYYSHQLKQEQTDFSRVSSVNVSLF